MLLGINVSYELKIYKGQHCAHCVHTHLVIVTKYRRKVLKDEHLDRIKTLFNEICQKQEIELIEFEGEDNHVHLLIQYPPKVCISKLVNQLKGVSSRKMKQEFSILKNYFFNSGIWSSSYFAGSCGGAPIDIIKQYIEQQNRTPENKPYIPHLKEGALRQFLVNNSNDILKKFITILMFYI